MKPADALLDMQVTGLFDALDAGGFVTVDFSRVHGRAGLTSRPNGPQTFLQPYQQGGRWWITEGFVEGAFIEGSGQMLDLVPNGMVAVRCRVSRNVSASNDPTGRHRVDRAVLLSVADGELPEVETSPSVNDTNRLLFRVSEKGEPLSLRGQTLLEIDPSTLIF